MFAPTSMKATVPAKVGTAAAIPGLCTPSSRLKYIWLPATNAPVLPAEITASSGFSAFCEPSLHITTSELSCLPRTASTGLSSIEIVCVVPTTSTWAGPRVAVAIPSLITCSSP